VIRQPAGTASRQPLGSRA